MENTGSADKKNTSIKKPGAEQACTKRENVARGKYACISRDDYVPAREPCTKALRHSRWGGVLNADDR